jgi:hypothetical protein
MTPSHGADSALVTFKGVLFGTSGGDSVYFNGKPGKLISSNDTVLVAMVPTLAGSGPVTVHVQGKVLSAGTFAYDTTYKVSLVADSLGSPWYLTLDETGNIYVPTYNDFSIHTITPQGVVDTLTTLAGAMGILRDNTGNFYVTRMAGAPGPYILKLSSTGQFLDTVAADPGMNFGQIAMDGSGNFYVPNDASSSVDKVTPAGVVTHIGTNFHHPSGIAVAPDGTVFVDYYLSNAYANGDGRIAKISPSGQISDFAQVNYDGQSGLTLDANGNLYTTVFDQQHVLGWVDRISPNGTVTKLVSPNLLFPAGIALGKDGTIFVVEQSDVYPPTLNGGVYKLTPH